MRRFVSILIVLAFASPIFAQDAGWTFSGRFQGSSNDSGLITKVDPTLGYDFNRHVRTYIGLPVYLVKKSTTTTPTTPPTTTTETIGSGAGVGNAYLGFDFTVDSDAVNFVSTIEATAPTGNEQKGFSTGRMTVDWTNTFSHSFTSVTPFASAGLANTVSDTSFFVRPFSSLGLVSHFDGGLRYAVSPVFDIGALVYAVQASGEQKVFSKLLDRGPATTGTTSTTSSVTDTGKNRGFDTKHEIIGTAELANDHGVSTWVSAHAGSKTDLQVGFTRSAGYDLNTVFFGIGFHFGK
jgi:hypothetical protein